jgi:rhamnosyltransferase
MSHNLDADVAERRVFDTVCIIVCYRPSVAPLLALCANLTSDGANVVIVDNTEKPFLSGHALPAGCSLITLGYNSGIAHAQNVGVAAALDDGAAVLVFFDQDSGVAPGFLAALVAPLTRGKAEITSPRCVDDDSGLALPSLRLGRLGTATTFDNANSTSPYPVDIVISSGTAATKEALEITGPFDEALFIDSVDTEWCLRCRSRRIPIRVVPAAVMRHRIGSRSIRVGSLTVLLHSPVRCYYQIRNCFHLLRRKHVPLAFALNHMLSVMLSRIMLLWFVEGRGTYIRVYLTALRDGMKGVAGAKPA